MPTIPAILHGSGCSMRRAPPATRASSSAPSGSCRRILPSSATRLRRAIVVDPDALVTMDADAVIARSDPAERAVGRTEAERMRAALSGVPAEQRRALVMAGILGLTAAEVAEREGIPLGTAKTRIRSAMRKLRAELAPDEPGRAGS